MNVMQMDNLFERSTLLRVIFPQAVCGLEIVSIHKVSISRVKGSLRARWSKVITCIFTSTHHSRQRSMRYSKTNALILENGKGWHLDEQWKRLRGRSMHARDRQLKYHAIKCVCFARPCHTLGSDFSILAWLDCFQDRSTRMLLLSMFSRVGQTSCHSCQQFEEASRVV